MLGDRDLIQLFENAYTEYHIGYHRDRDPISLVHEYQDPADQEVVALLVSCLSYGNVKAIIKGLRAILPGLGEHPAQTLLNGHRSFGVPRGFYYRFNNAHDIECLLVWMSQALKSHGSLENFYADAEPATTLAGMSSFVRRLCAQPLPKDLAVQRQHRDRSIKYLLCDPIAGSACKRFCMFLRWVVRPADGIDLGLWTKLSPSKLVLPVDTHLLKTLRLLNWTKSNSATWKVASEATLRLRRLNPDDPLKYDFALCHLSMSGDSLSVEV